MEKFIIEHIRKFNERPSSFKYTNPNETQIKDYLRKKIYGFAR